MTDLYPHEWNASPEIPQPEEVPAEGPVWITELPNGQEAVVHGDVLGYADFCHKQGDNPYGFGGTCGLASSAEVLNQFGVPATEADVVERAVATGACSQVPGDPEASGGTTADAQARLLGDFGIPAHTEQGVSLEDLASNVEQGHGVILEANAGHLWNDATYLDDGGANHAVMVTGVVRDPRTGAVSGFFINDFGTGQAGRFVDTSTMTDAWLGAGGGAVVTDFVHPASREQAA